MRPKLSFGYEGYFAIVTFEIFSRNFQYKNENETCQYSMEN